MPFHQAVMAEEVLRFLEPKSGELFFDGTVGGGGHAGAVLERCPDCRLLAVDRDPEALAVAKEVLAPMAERVRFLQKRFDKAVVEDIPLGTLDGALLDLGVSSHQLDSNERGFGFRRGLKLDMRMEGAEGGMSAAELLNEGSEEELGRIFREYGEERRWRRLAREVVRRRSDEPFECSDQLVGALQTALGRPTTPRDRARIFQALRIAVNGELDALEGVLPELRERLVPAGRIVVISYHSLEDRIVKRAFQDWSRSCVCPPDMPICSCRGEPLGEVLTRRPLRPSADEVALNPRARSALLRAWKKAA